jgi:hypothetical protein
MKRQKQSHCMLILITATLLLASCGPNQLFGPTITPTPTELESASEIYREALAQDDEDSSNSVDYCSGGLALFYLTQSGELKEEDWKWVQKQFPKVEQETWENFYKLNLQPINMPENLDVGCKYTLITTEALNEMDINNNTGVDFLSRIGFNSRKDQALVYRGYSDGYFCYEDLLYFERIDSTWKVTDMAGMVIC